MGQHKASASHKMPTIAVGKAELFKALGREYTTEEFDELCFEFGIELDEDTSQTKRPVVDGVEEPPQLKIEIPANRYDMLCFEGIALNLKVFLELTKLPKLSLTPPPGGELQRLIVKEEVILPIHRVIYARVNAETDHESSPTDFGRYIAEHHVHTSALRLFHRTTRQAPSEPSPAENSRLNRHS